MGLLRQGIDILGVEPAAGNHLEALVHEEFHRGIVGGLGVVPVEDDHIPGDFRECGGGVVGFYAAIALDLQLVAPHGHAASLDLGDILVQPEGFFGKEVAGGGVLAAFADAEGFEGHLVHAHVVPFGLGVALQVFIDHVEDEIVDFGMAWAVVPVGVPGFLFGVLVFREAPQFRLSQEIPEMGEKLGHGNDLDAVEGEALRDLPVPLLGGGVSAGQFGVAFIGEAPIELEGEPIVFQGGEGVDELEGDGHFPVCGGGEAMPAPILQVRPIQHPSLPAGHPALFLGGQELAEAGHSIHQAPVAPGQDAGLLPNGEGIGLPHLPLLQAVKLRRPPGAIHLQDDIGLLRGGGADDFLVELGQIHLAQGQERLLLCGVDGQSQGEGADSRPPGSLLGRGDDIRGGAGGGLRLNGFAREEICRGGRKGEAGKPLAVLEEIPRRAPPGTVLLGSADLPSPGQEHLEFRAFFQVLLRQGNGEVGDPPVRPLGDGGLELQGFDIRQGSGGGVGGVPVPGEAGNPLQVDHLGALFTSGGQPQVVGDPGGGVPQEDFQGVVGPLVLLVRHPPLHVRLHSQGNHLECALRDRQAAEGGRLAGGGQFLPQQKI